MEHDQSSYFCRGPAPVGPTIVTGLISVNSVNVSIATWPHNFSTNFLAFLSNVAFCILYVLTVTLTQTL